MNRSNLIVERCGKYPLYILGDIPFWFVPNTSADEILQMWIDGKSVQDVVQLWGKTSGQSRCGSELDIFKLFDSINPPPYSPYRGRKFLELKQLSEIWFHVTEACNLACKHCLFADGHSQNRSLAKEEILSAIYEAHGLGCRLFCFTGGEPFVHPAFLTIIEEALRYDDTRVVTLTNGMLIQDYLGELEKLPYRRMHFQVSIDGSEPIHDSLRGHGTFLKSINALKSLVDSQVPCSIAMAINEKNVRDMASVVKLANEIGVRTVHFLWHFRRGKGETLQIVPIKTLICHLEKAMGLSRKTGVLIDNVEALRAQVFTPAGTRFDFGNGAWESLAVGPDGSIYPTPAMVGIRSLSGGNIRDGIERTWRESQLLREIREISLVDVPGMQDDPWRFIIGGGDLDHCIINSASNKGPNALSADPYVPVYKYIARKIIEEEALALPEPPKPGLIFRMGDAVHECPTTADVNFTHCNCLLSIGEKDLHGLVRQFYGERSHQTDKTIVNPVNQDDDVSRILPKEVQLRSYGCGSPVEDANISPGETVVDLGSGTGIECFIASEKTGKRGLVIGVDMTDEMIQVARKAKKEAEEALGFSNTIFVKGVLEDVPVSDNSADVVISNCVINLTGNKRRVFKEIARILKPGGRMVISDVVTEEEPPLSIRADQELTGECIGGAMVQTYLFSLLEDIGFSEIKIVKRFPYRVVQGHRFYSLTFSAIAPGSKDRSVPVMYGGPFKALVTEDGRVLGRGKLGSILLQRGTDENKLSMYGIYVVDQESGSFTNLDASSSCSCHIPAETTDGDVISEDVPETGCLICGEPLVYLTVPEKRICARCGNTGEANAVCKKGHFVCDLCHIQDPIEVIKKVCLASRERDMVKLLQAIRSHKKVPIHGPEHHALVPGVILTTYRNLGGNITDEDILTGIKRGTQIPGGSCAFMGICGAAAGVGIAFSIILDANPLTPKRRRKVQKLVSRIIGKISGYDAARCCQRECYVALKEAASLSKEVLPVSLLAEFPLSCNQHSLNRECIKARCTVYPRYAKGIPRLKENESQIFHDGEV